MNTRHYGIPISSEVPITGVVDTTAPEWLLEEIYQHGIDIDFEEHLKECSKELHDDCYYNDCPSYTIGYKKDEKGDFVPDFKAEFSAIVNGNENTTQVTRSRWTSRAALCSPCYPGQGDLGTSGEYLVCTLPPDIWGDTEHLPISELNKALQSIRMLYEAFYNTDLDAAEFAIEFFYMIGELLNGKRLDELRPAGKAAEALRELLDKGG